MTAPLKLGVVAQRKYFIPYREAMVRAMHGLGHAAESLEDLDYGRGLNAFLVVGPHKHRGRVQRRQDVVHACVQTEQFPTPEAGAETFGKERYAIFLDYAPDYDLVFEWHRNTARFLTAARVASGGRAFPPVHWLPYGAFREMAYPECVLLDEASPGDAHQAQPTASPRRVRTSPRYDLIFIGALGGVDDRRDRLLEALASRFTIHPKSQGIWGWKKGPALADAAIALNLHFDHAATFESPRLFEYCCNGRFVLSEYIHDPAPFTAGRDYADCGAPGGVRPEPLWRAGAAGTPRVAAALVEAVSRWLDDPAGRDRMAAQALTTAWAQPMARAAQSVAAQLNALRAERRAS